MLARSVACRAPRPRVARSVNAARTARAPAQRVRPAGNPMVIRRHVATSRALFATKAQAGASKAAPKAAEAPKTAKPAESKVETVGDEFNAKIQERLESTPEVSFGGGTLGGAASYIYRVAVMNNWDLHKLRSDLEHFAKTCTEKESWRVFYLDPPAQWGTAEYNRAMQEHLDALPYDASTKYVISWLKQTNKLRSVKYISDRFSEGLLNLTNDFSGVITTGKPLSEEELTFYAERIANEISQTNPGEPPTVRLTNEVDPNIRSGYRLTISSAGINVDKTVSAAQQ